MKTSVAPKQSGFSLVELLVAMVATLIVSGAIFGLMTTGQRTFRREPEYSDRQQNIRTAMDLIMNDVAGAGLGMPSGTQIFQRNLNACSTCDLGDGYGGATIGPDVAGVTDELQFLTVTEGCPREEICAYPGGASAELFAKTATTCVKPGSSFMIFLKSPPAPPPTRWTMRQAKDANDVEVSINKAGSGGCEAGEPHAHINTPPGSGPLNSAGGLCGADAVGNTSSLTPAQCEPDFILSAAMVHYRVRRMPDSSGVPVSNLYRRSTENWLAGWQMIARGIEDMQVQYVDGNDYVDGDQEGDWADQPTDIAGGTGAMTTHVRVTLSAHTIAPNTGGELTSANLGAAVRGSLQQTQAVRSALLTLAKESTTTSSTWK